MAAYLSFPDALRKWALLTAAAFATLAVFTLASVPSQADIAAPKLKANGLHAQPWLMDSTLDLNRDLEAANQAGKALAIFWEQEG